MADLSDKDPTRDHDHEESEGTNKKRKMMTIPLSTYNEMTTGWEHHTLNICDALRKADKYGDDDDHHHHHFRDMMNESVSILQGIGPFATRVLHTLGLDTVEQLGEYKFFRLARALHTLAETEVVGGRSKRSVMNVDKALTKTWESKSFTEIVEAPTDALEGISREACDLLETLGCKTIADLANFKYCRWAEAICVAAKYENTLTAKERKVEAALKKLG